MGRLLPPVIGSMLQHRVAGQVRTRVHISGDTLTGHHIDEIARHAPDIDLAIVHLGGTRVLLHTVTMDDVQGVDYLRRLGPRAACPCTTTTTGSFGLPCPVSSPVHSANSPASDSTS